MITPTLRADLAPTGKLRVGINYGNPVLATRDPGSGELRGVAVDLARELGKRVDVPVELVGFESAGQMVAGLKAGAWDVAFLAIDPGRAGEIDFTAPYIEIEGTYLVPAGSPLRTIADVDRAGVRIGVSANSAYDLFLSRELQRAELVRAPDPTSAFELVVAGKVDVVAGVRQSLMANAEKLPGSRVFAGRFMAIQQALGIPKGHDEGAKYLRSFIEDVKTSGLVARAIEKAGVRGVSVAPVQESTQ
jgi:polar amino acid transport system substrate-binding protein